MREDSVKEGLSSLKSAVGLTNVCSAGDFAESAVDPEAAADADVLMLDELKIAVVDADPQQAGALSTLASEDSSILAVEPERIMYALSQVPGVSESLSGAPLEYLRGYKDAVNAIYAALTGAAGEISGDGFEPLATPFADSATYTWGLQATRVSQSRYTGRGIRLAVLDTGFDLQHPDFVGRSVVSKSFITAQTVQDGNGHGTHCVGTSMGNQQTAGGSRRYGCASRAAIYVGKVLSNQGSGADGGILAGINWAIANKCRVVSMSLGAATQPNEPFSAVYENVAQRALRANTLIIAAAGNESRRPAQIASVGRPANCPSILAVAALDANLGVSSFSCGGLNPNGGGVDIAAPGRNVFSSWPMPSRYNTISGTSMATPHVAGIAAMWLEAHGASTTARGLWQLLVSNARRLPLTARDVGAGLVLAPL
jgi:subtilisin family serine protease